MNSVLLLVMTVSAVYAAPTLDVISNGLSDIDYSFETNTGTFPEQIVMPQKKAALVLDRLLIALQKALHEDSANQRAEAERDGPRTAPLRLANFEINDVPGLQRRGQGSGRGRVLRCYFNAVTCF